MEKSPRSHEEPLFRTHFLEQFNTKSKLTVKLNLLELYKFWTKNRFSNLKRTKMHYFLFLKIMSILMMKLTHFPVRNENTTTDWRCTCRTDFHFLSPSLSQICNAFLSNVFKSRFISYSDTIFQINFCMVSLFRNESLIVL